MFKAKNSVSRRDLLAKLLERNSCATNSSRRVKALKSLDTEEYGIEESAKPRAKKRTAHPEHVEKLKAGFEEWHAWRENNREIRPNLIGADLQNSNLVGFDLSDVEFKGADLRGSDLSNSVLVGADLSGVNLTGADLRDANISFANLGGAKLSEALLDVATLKSSNLSYADLSGAGLTFTNFEYATLEEANLSDANLFYANLTGADLSLARFENSNVTGVRYRRRSLRNRCHGIRVQSAFGNALWLRDVTDQDFLDQIESHLIRDIDRGDTALHMGDSFPFRRKVENFVHGVTSGFAKPLALISGTIVGLVLGTMIVPGGGAALLDHLIDLEITALAAYAYITLGGALLAGLLAGAYGQLAIFRLWGLFDYGRDWYRVVLFALIMILSFGCAYSVLGSEHIEMLRTTTDDIWFYPWFVALMGFTTLGVSDLVEPTTGLGAIMIMGNVLSGFVTLGLLLSVLGDKFARRT